MTANGNGEDKIFLEMICRQITGPEMINLCRRLSTLFEGQKVDIRLSDDTGELAYILRVNARERIIRNIWPRIQSHLKTEGFLQHCEAFVHGPSSDYPIKLWPV